MKVTRAISSKLFKYVKKIDVSFNPFDKRTTSARELLRQVQAERIQKSNPKMVLKVDLLGTADPPLVNFEFVDGTKKNFDSQQFLATEMLGDIYTIANNLDIEYELAGKSVDDN